MKRWCTELFRWF